MSNVDELGKLDALHQNGTPRGPEFAAEEARLLDELLATADLGSHATPELRPGYEMGDTEVPHDQGQAEPGSVAPQPDEETVTASSFAYSPPSPPEPTFTATTTTPSTDDEFGTPEEQHQDGESNGPVGEVAKQPEVAPASFDLDSPDELEARPDDQASGAESADDLGRAALASVLQHPDKPAETASTFVFALPASLDSTLTDPTTTSEDETRSLAAPYRDEAGESTESAVEDAKHPDEAPGSAELSSFEVPEGPSDDDLSQAEAPSDDDRTALESVTELPKAITVTESPYPYNPSPPLVLAFSETTPSEEEPSSSVPLRQDETAEAAELAVEEAEQAHELPASAELASLDEPEGRPVDQAGVAETGDDKGQADLSLTSDQPEEEVVTGSPFAYNPSPLPEPTFTDNATPSEDQETAPLEALRQDEATEVTELVAEDAAQPDEIPASIDSSSAETPKPRSDDRTTETETPSEPEQAELATAVDQPEEEVVTLSPFAYQPPPPPETAFTDTTAPTENDEADTPEALHQDETVEVTELVAEEAEQTDEVRAPSVDLSSAETPELQADAQPSDVETSDEQAQADPGLAAQQAEEEVVTLSPFAYLPPPSPEPTFTDATAPTENDEAATPEVLHEDETVEVTELVAEEAEQAEEVPAPSVELSSAETPELQSYAQTGDVETNDEQGQTDLESAAQPEDEASVWRFAYSPQTWGPTISDATTPSEDDEPQSYEAYHDETGEDTEAASEEAEQPAVLPTSFKLSSSDTAEEQADEQAGDLETSDDHGEANATPAQVVLEEAVTASPKPPATHVSETTLLGETRSRRRSRTSRIVVTVLAVVFFLTTLGAGFVALKQNKSASQWRQDDRNAVALNAGLLTRNAELSKDLLSAHAALASLNSQTANLNAKVTSLQAQVSAGGKAQAKNLERALLSQLTSETGTASNGLAACVGDMNSLQAEIDHDIANPAYRDPHLQSNTQSADQVCAKARQDNQQIQSTLNGAS
ncbi:MAG: hypothetical protein ABSD97_06840 [Acidimicrobiales bacterium]|jgi:hypothetical protein